MKGHNQRSIILIDGSNFYFKLKDLRIHHQLHFDFSNFIKSLAGDTSVVSSTYYVGRIRTDGTEKTQHLFNQQRSLLAHLKKNEVGYSLGYLLKSDGKFHEKGVDVNIAMDLLIAAYENLADRIILISSDTDLIPAVKKAQSKGILVEYVGFSHKPSVAMVANCTETTLLKEKDLKKFVANG